MLTAMAKINIELTNRCAKVTRCACCGHQDPKVNGSMKFGDMDFALLESIADQLPTGIAVSWHRDGEPTDYNRLGEALQLFREHPSSLVTHGERLNEKAAEIINQCTTVTCSVVPKDPDRQIQLESVRGFLAKKGTQRPMFHFKFVGRIDNPEEYEALGVPITNRALHAPRGNWNYHKVDPIVPEIRVCLDFLNSPTVRWDGKFFQCNRLNISDEGLLGDLNVNTLDELWNSQERMRMLQAHLDGRRDLANPLCARCEFYGVPTPAG